MGDARDLGDGAEEQLSYEAAREELVETVRKLEAGGITLEDSLALWERGEHLATVCQQWLEGVGQRLDASIADQPEQNGQTGKTGKSG